MLERTFVTANIKGNDRQVEIACKSLRDIFFTTVLFSMSCNVAETVI
jgi:hypothetical protein